MAFRLKPSGSIAGQLDRLVRKEFRKALRHLASPTPDEDAIHHARTSVKRIRAVLRLLHDGLGAHYAAENRRLRSAGHGLARLRDLDATGETLRLLRARYPTVVHLSVTRAVGRGLPTRRHHTKARTSRSLARAVQAIQRSRRTAPDRVRHAGGLAAVRSGVVRGYRRARNGMENLTHDSDPAAFHVWRRRVKDHSYHMQLFARLHATPRSRAAHLKQLDDWLGNDHDLATLRAMILAARSQFGDARTTALVLGCIVKYQTWVRERALKLGRRLFTDAPHQFRRSVTTWRAS